MSHSYTVNNANAAKIGGAGRINETGGYEGQFTRVEPVTSERGTIGIEFDFKSKDGATASFIQVWTQKADGEDLSGRAVIDALMLLLRVKTMAPAMAIVEKWDNDAKQVTKQKVECFTELMNKDIGLVLQKEHSMYNDQPKSKMLIYAAYDIATRKTPKEIVNKAPKATALDSMLAIIKDKFDKTMNQPATNRPVHHGGHAGARPAASTSFSDMDDDIPF